MASGSSWHHSLKECDTPGPFFPCTFDALPCIDAVIIRVDQHNVSLGHGIKSKCNTAHGLKLKEGSPNTMKMLRCEGSDVIVFFASIP